MKSWTPDITPFLKPAGVHFNAAEERPRGEGGAGARPGVAPFLVPPCAASHLHFALIVVALPLYCLAEARSFQATLPSLLPALPCLPSATPPHPQPNPRTPSSVALSTAGRINSLAYKGLLGGRPPHADEAGGWIALQANLVMWHSQAA